MLDSVEGMDLKITINHSNDFFKNLTENFCTGCGRRKVCWNYCDPSSVRGNKGQEMGHYWKCNYGSLDWEGKKLERRGEVCLVKELNINMIICLVLRNLLYLLHLLRTTLSYSHYSRNTHPPWKYRDVCFFNLVSLEENVSFYSKLSDWCTGERSLEPWSNEV